MQSYDHTGDKRPLPAQVRTFMTGVELTGLPALIIVIGTVVIGATPVWLAAKVVGAGGATLPRAIAAILLGTIGAVVAVAATGGWGLLLGPLVFLLVLKYILQTSFFGAIVLMIIASVIAATMGKLIGSGIIPLH